MSKNIFDEAKTILENICIDFDELTIPPHRDSDLHFYTIYKKEIDKIDEALEKAQKQEKLLGLYRQLVKDLGLFIEHDTTDTWDGPEDYEYLEIDYDSIKALNTYKQIKERENE